ncbi:MULTISPECIES: permease-like cell division protein FtsX [Virgibacillus]|uniref:Cell division protein FtsX n=3 Tax=Virgibacillus TaxID=84406 RepID=A0A024QA02_9BACI|nr:MULTISPECIES: permease-like cell division protein FtsX [Virgibacillus]EQB37467.1 cell division protein FtsX [Virgibacillus sp. CM-4]MYL40218.1 FtsX-like permease family protein [Virgibacillus massiliensis]GGJ60700.1 cell division protein FtsX [Virgibacillus kapii]CDQ39015.1 Cell division protein FtsX [Virgibacillus massiliensis]
MKVRTLMRHIREGFKNIGRNGWMTIASVGAVTTTLILVGAFLALMLNLNEMADNIEDDVQIDAMIEQTADEEQIQNLGNEIEKINGVQSAVFSSKDDQLNSLIDSMGENGQAWQMFEQDNPLNHVFVVKTADPQDTAPVAKQINELQGIQSVNYGQGVVEKLFEFNSYARTIGLVLILGLVFTAIFLISNTIKITIMARSKEIGIMKLVGATNGFIRWPFFIEGLLLGVLGSIIPVAIILTGYYYLVNNISQHINYSFIEILPFNPFAFQLALIIVAIGALIGVWGSVMSVRKFLKV